MTVRCAATHWREFWCRAHRAKARELVLPGHLQHLHEGIGELRAKTAAEACQGVVVRVLVAGDEPEGKRIVGSPLDLAARMRPRRVAVDQQGQQHRRMVGVAAAARVGTRQRRQVQGLHHIDHVARQVRFGQPVLHRRRQQIVGLAVYRAEAAHALDVWKQCVILRER
jgi:hypothetical protein